ncbi:MAG TPA: cytochrome c oxidase subunit 4 [Actinomycetota bacterium]|jgi:hypothetical protein|nr:cytochrome c oxidase subunit 4 [Actinomycetota bacterium]
MAEELRFFARTALFALLAGIIYWFVSYERAGSLLFAFVALGAGFFAVAAWIFVAGARGTGGAESVGAAAARTLGFEDRPGDEHGPLTVEDELIPPASIWPLVAAAAATLIGVGLIYGPWFWLPGAALAAATAYGWLTEMTR